MEPLPDLPTLSDDDLRVMIRELEKEEDEISFRRRILHGRIDILRAELVARLREQVSAGEAKLADVERLSEILAGKAGPGDLVLTLGAGDITLIGPEVLDVLSSEGVDHG